MDTLVGIQATLGKGEVESSILSRSTILSIKINNKSIAVHEPGRAGSVVSRGKRAALTDHSG